jgi:hypothetical protein
MAKIRISKNDEQEYKRLVRNAKAKMRRLQKQHGIDLTNEISFLLYRLSRTVKSLIILKKILISLTKV